MREIKFRAWDKQEARMLDNYACRVNFSVYVGGGLGRYVPLQYTGLKDKNRKEIYEGDIMKYEGGDIICSIYWDNDQGMYRFTNNVGINSFYPDKSKLEVMGNIYENPELLQTSERSNK